MMGWLLCLIPLALAPWAVDSPKGKGHQLQMSAFHWSPLVLGPGSLFLLIESWKPVSWLRPAGNRVSGIGCAVAIRDWAQQPHPGAVKMTDCWLPCNISQSLSIKMNGLAYKLKWPRSRHFFFFSYLPTPSWVYWWKQWDEPGPKCHGEKFAALSGIPMSPFIPQRKGTQASLSPQCTTRECHFPSCQFHIGICKFHTERGS